jgi:glycosyltransferase involved in cell wall biosynthesis
VVVLLISVILPVRNGMPWLEEQLSALAVQECRTPWEVVVTDNGSTDGSREWAKSWVDQHREFRFEDASESSGAPAARNAGVRAAKGELLAFCDADDVVRPGWIAGCAVALGSADVVAGVFDFWTLNGGAPSPIVPAATRQLGFLPAGLSANLMVRRSAFEAVGGFDEEQLIGEDIDLCWRLQLQGFRFDIAPDAIVAKRARTGFKPVLRQSFSYGCCGPLLYRRYRAVGAHRDVNGAIRAWAWLLVSLPSLLRPDGRLEWIHAAGVRVGRLVGSLKERAFFP